MIGGAVDLIRRSRYLVAFTGAGVSAESGIPTFRGDGGLWRRFRPEELATPEAFRRDPVRVWEWYRWRMELIRRAEPNPAHIVLAEMEKSGLLKALITQNVDGLHQRAGSRNVIELHGNIWRVRCTGCGRVKTLTKPPERIPPLCEACGGLLRPDVVWFGEPLPPAEWEKALAEASFSDVMLVIGTSGVVMPAGMLPWMVKEHGGSVIEINPEYTAISEIADVKISMKAGEAMRRLGEALGLL